MRNKGVKRYKLFPVNNQLAASDELRITRWRVRVINLVRKRGGFSFAIRPAHRPGVRGGRRLCGAGISRGVLFRRVLPCAFLLVSLFAPMPSMAEESGYLTQLRQRAMGERLAERPEWRTLLHYKPRRFSGGIESLVDSESFFLSPEGKHDPQAELDATLAAFFETDAAEPDKSAQCTFAGRFHWLDHALKFDPDRLPRLPCPRFNRWLDRMNPERLTLVFPAAYLNNPASMFGHTLLRVDAADQDESTSLLAHAVNYAADTQDQRGVMYAVNGLFGGYEGRFSIAPYYLAVREYGDIENRDIWEYGLNLTPEEIGRMLRHLWEMRAARFDYYFLDENCSFHLLSLLEAARPGLNLTDRFSWWVIPSETVRAVMEAGLIDGVRYRPARNTVLMDRARHMDDGMQMLAKRMVDGGPGACARELGSLTPADQARVIDLALDYAAYRQSPRFGKEKLPSGTVPELLEARSRLEAPDLAPVIPMPEVRPGEGHKPARAGIGYGFEDRRQFVELTLRPGYHDLLDPEGGFTPGAAVRAFDTAVRLYPEEGKVELERLDVVEITSLSDWGRFLRPLSWKAGAGVGRKRVSPRERLLMGRIHAGFGISGVPSDGTTLFAMAQGTLELSDRFDYFLAPGLGPAVGVVHDVTESWRSGLSFLWQSFFLDEWRNDCEAVFGNRFTIGRQSAAGLELSWKREFGHGYTGVKAYWQVYF